MAHEEAVKKFSMTKRKNTKKILGPAFSSYHGRVHIPGITTESTIFADKKIYINSVCAGHVIVDESDMFRQKSSLTGETV